MDYGAQWNNTSGSQNNFGAGSIAANYQVRGSQKDSLKASKEISLSGLSGKKEPLHPNDSKIKYDEGDEMLNFSKMIDDEEQKISENSKEFF